MIATICSYCDCVMKTHADGKREVVYSHGICRKCLPAVQDDVNRQIAEMDAAEAAGR